MSITCEVIQTSGLYDLQEAFVRDVLAGLSRRPKEISSAWFYDERGSRLFEQITRLEEYYLTRCEREILETHAGGIAKMLAGAPFRVLEIGAGDGHKTEILLRRFLHEGLAFEYVPIDICQRSIVDLVAKLRRGIARGSFHVRGIVGEYRDALDVLECDRRVRNLVLFLGSSIGNFTHGQSRRFLRGLRSSLSAGDLVLIGFDLKKDPEIVRQAYDDAQGITAEFNYNLLERINRELGGGFDRRRFAHHASYNVRQGCMESWLVSRCRQTVPIEACGGDFTFDAWEGMRLERSYKYDLPLIQRLATSSGFGVVRLFDDHRGYFLDALWTAS